MSTLQKEIMCAVFFMVAKFLAVVEGLFAYVTMAFIATSLYISVVELFGIGIEPKCVVCISSQSPEFQLYFWIMGVAITTILCSLIYLPSVLLDAINAKMHGTNLSKGNTSYPILYAMLTTLFFFASILLAHVIPFHISKVFLAYRCTIGQLLVSYFCCRTSSRKNTSPRPMNQLQVNDAPPAYENPPDYATLEISEGTIKNI